MKALTRIFGKAAKGVSTFIKPNAAAPAVSKHRTCGCTDGDEMHTVELRESVMDDTGETVNMCMFHLEKETAATGKIIMM